jgi:hypothetical protein
MRKSLVEQLSLTPVPIAHVHAQELVAMAALLERLPEAVALVHEDISFRGGRRVDPSKGRDGMAAEQVLRVAVLKQHTGLSYERLAFALARPLKRGTGSTRLRHQKEQGFAQELLDIEKRFTAERVPDGRRHFATSEAEAAQRREHLRGRLERRLAFQLSFRADRARYLGAFANLRFDVRRAEDLPGAGQIVRAAKQAEIVERRRAAQCKGRSMLERQEALLDAARSLTVDERALRTVSLPHRALDCDGHVPRARFEGGCLSRLACPEPPARLALDERIERPLEQLAQVAARQRVAQELPSLLDLLVKLGRSRKLDAPARRG